MEGADSWYDDSHLNSQEKKHCAGEWWFTSALHALRYLECRKVGKLAQKAWNRTEQLMAAGKLTPKTGVNGAGDAFRHCFWSALITLALDRGRAEGYGNRHEYGNTPPTNRQKREHFYDMRKMDLHNNGVGRDLASRHGANEAKVEQACIYECRQGGRLWVLYRIWGGRRHDYSEPHS
ncbi:MAG: hypothetical protein M3R70_06505 [Actinomycetota bacterium]|nr:hypothetical protein [Actinomycetota bacterium]